MLNPITRPVGNSIGQMQRKLSPESTRRRYNVHIQKVNYVTRHLKVSGRGYSGPKKVAVQMGIPLGTADKPIVTISNMATIEMQEDGTWLCVGIRRKQMCATGTGGVEDVAVDNDFDPFDSNQTDGYGNLVIPSDLFLPPIEPLGEFTLPANRFAGSFSPLCNVPPCPDCAPDGYVPGMSPILTEEFCWVWGFKGASCGLYFRSQGAYFTYDSSDTRTLDQVVAVRENYAYIASVGLDFDFVVGYKDAHLYTVDITDPAFPVIVDDMAIVGQTGYAMVNLGIAVKADTLWVSGTLYQKGIDSPAPTTIQMNRYDISTRTSPSIVGNWPTRLINTFKVFLHYDTGTQTFTGDPYLVGVNWDYTDETLCQTEFIVEDGLIGGEVQTLTGYTFGRQPLISVLQYLYTNPPIICDNIVVLRYYTGTGASDSEQHILAIDLEDIPSSLAVLWDDDGVPQPRVYLGNNHMYTFGATGNRLYTQTDVDNTWLPVAAGLPSDSASVQNWGYWVKTNCLLRVGNNLSPNGWSVNIVDQENPILRSQANEPITGGGGNGAGQDASADNGVTVNRTYLAHVIGGGQIAYLSVYTSP